MNWWIGAAIHTINFVRSLYDPTWQGDEWFAFVFGLEPLSRAGTASESSAPPHHAALQHAQQPLHAALQQAAAAPRRPAARQSRAGVCHRQAWRGPAGAGHRRRRAVHPAPRRRELAEEYGVATSSRACTANSVRGGQALADVSVFYLTASLLQTARPRPRLLPRPAPRSSPSSTGDADLNLVPRHGDLWTPGSSQSPSRATSWLDELGALQAPRGGLGRGRVGRDAVLPASLGRRPATTPSCGATQRPCPPGSRVHAHRWSWPAGREENRDLGVRREKR